VSEIERLLDIMRRLRSEDGCPWDREQTLQSLRPFAVEEVYEVLDAIDREHVGDHCEELGDLLLQVVFQAQLRAEEGAFSFEDVARGINEKLIRRHPHVFGDHTASNSSEVLETWNAIKAQEKAAPAADASALDGVPRELPALLKAHELQKKAAKVGFDWPDAGAVLDKVQEELDELRDAVASGDKAHAVEELGDLLFAAANVGRHLQVTAEQALQDGNQKFSRRFQTMEHTLIENGKALQDCSLAEMDEVWNKCK